MGLFGKKIKVPCEEHGFHMVDAGKADVGVVMLGKTRGGELKMLGADLPEDMPNELRQAIMRLAPERVAPRNTAAPMPAAAFTPPPVPKSNMPIYSELDRMVIRTKEAVLGEDVAVMIKSVGDEYKLHTLPKDHAKVEAAVMEGFRIISNLLVDNEHNGMSPVHEAMLAEFGDTVLASFKKKAGR